MHLCHFAANNSFSVNISCRMRLGQTQISHIVFFVSLFSSAIFGGKELPRGLQMRSERRVQGAVHTEMNPKQCSWMIVSLNHQLMLSYNRGIVRGYWDYLSDHSCYSCVVLIPCIITGMMIQDDPSGFPSDEHLWTVGSIRF